MTTCDPRDIWPNGNSPDTTGQLLVAGNGITVCSSSWSSTLELNLPENQHFRDMQARMEAIESRLAILNPNEELQKRFPALQEAYDHYKLIEKLVNDQTK